MSSEKGYGKDRPFANHLGIERVANDEGRALIALNVRPEPRNSWRAAHGGVIMTLLDSAMSLAARLHVHTAPVGIITLEMNAKFISAGMGSRLSAEGKVIGGGRSTLFCEAEVRDESGKLLAKGMGTFTPMRKQDP